MMRSAIRTVLMSTLAMLLVLHCLSLMTPCNGLRLRHQLGLRTSDSEEEKNVSLESEVDTTVVPEHHHSNHSGMVKAEEDEEESSSW